MIHLVLLLGTGLFTAANGNVDKGNKLFEAGKLQEALDEYDKAARTLPGEPGVRFNRGAALYGLGKYDDAQREFLRATEAHDPQLKESAFYNMGNSFYRLQRYKEAVDAYKRALSTDPRDVRAKWNLEMALRKLQEEEKKKPPPQKNDDQQKQQQQQQQQQQAQQQERKPQQKPEGVPQPKDKQKEEEQRQQQEAQAREKPVDKQDVEAVLDALERGEKNLELEQARQRARGRRKPNKDW
jgi:Ca-activated chloride channel family protein